MVAEVELVIVVVGGWCEDGVASAGADKFDETNRIASRSARFGMRLRARNGFRVIGEVVSFLNHR